MNASSAPPAPEGLCLSAAELRALGGIKWRQYEDDVLPCWVADMDFAVAPPLRDAVLRIASGAAYPYPARGPQQVAEAFSARMAALHGWQADPANVLVVSDLVQAIHAALVAFSARGDGVLLQMPAYPPFSGATEATGRRLIPLAARADGNRPGWDLRDLGGETLAGARVFILCNPQNPTGRVFSRGELEEIAEFCIARDLIILSDEIHADILHDNHRHIPIASLSPEVAARTVTLNSATKSFNMPGLRCAVMHFGAPELLRRFTAAVPPKLLGSPGITGVEATVAAWTEGDAWFAGTLKHLTRMRDRLLAALRAQIPDITVQAPEATYLAWLDCRRLGIEGSAYEFFLREARVACSPGENFAPGATGFVRLNFATSPEILDQIVGRMAEALRRRSR